MHLMPQLATFNPSLPEVLACTAEWARAEEEWWDTELDRLEPEILTIGPETVLFNTVSFVALPVAVQRRLLRRAVGRVRGSLRSIDFRHIEAIRQLTQSPAGSGRIQLPGLDIYRSFEWLRLAPPGYDSRLERDFEKPLIVPGVTTLPERRITIEMELVNPPAVYNSQMDVLDWGRCEGSVTVRNWRPGDSYTPAGRSGPAKIKTLFQENRVPLWERRHWPVIIRGESILWARRFGVAVEFASTPSSDRLLAIREAPPVSTGTGESNRTFATSIETGGSFTRTQFPQRARRTDDPDAEVFVILT
jgi:tRNA(Ile)-lysidine synthase